MGITSLSVTLSAYRYMMYIRIFLYIHVHKKHVDLFYMYAGNVCDGVVESLSK